MFDTRPGTGVACSQGGSRMTVGLLPSLGDEQTMLIDASVRFIEAERPIAALRKRAVGSGAADAGYRSTASDLGWFGLLAPEEHAGGSVSGNGVLDAALIAAERGARLQPGPFPGHCAAVAALSSVQPDAHAPALSDLVGGRSWATWAFGSHETCELRPAGADLRLDGVIDLAAEVADCDWLLLGARAPQGVAQVLLPLSAPGIKQRPVEGFDITRSWCALRLEGVRVRAEDLVGVPGPGTEERLARQAQLAAVLSAAETVGAMHADFELALRYSKDRIAFGRPIGSFQAIKHLLADTSLWLEMSKGLVATAATALGADAPDAAQQAHAAKAFVAEKSVELAHNCFQVFGGIGYTWDHDQHLFMRRMAADAVCFGSAEWHRARLLDAAGVER